MVFDIIYHLMDLPIRHMASSKYNSAYPRYHPYGACLQNSTYLSHLWSYDANQSWTYTSEAQSLWSCTATKKPHSSPQFCPMLALTGPLLHTPPHHALSPGYFPASGCDDSMHNCPRQSIESSPASMGRFQDLTKGFLD